MPLLAQGACGESGNAGSTDAPAAPVIAQGADVASGDDPDRVQPAHTQILEHWDDPALDVRFVEMPEATHGGNASIARWNCVRSPSRWMEATVNTP